MNAVLAAAVVSSTSLTATATIAVAPASAGATASCNTSTTVVAHFTTVITIKSSSPGELAKVTSVSIDNLSSSCDGLPAKVVFSGNPAGNPTAPATLLSTATSTLIPCSQANANKPPRVTGGAITLPLCSTPKSAARYVSVHELTRLTLFVNGVQVTIATASSSSSESGAGSNSGTNSAGRTVPVATASSSSLAFTGADIALMAAGGLLAILLGLFLLVVGRRRRTQTTGGDTE